MKKNLLLIICICFCLSCKKDKIERVENDKKMHVKKRTVILDTLPEKSFLESKPAEDKMLSYLKLKYEAVYQFKDSKDEEWSLQFLGITDVDENSIDFHLYTETLPCDTEYYGKAVVIKSDSLETAAKISLNEIIFTQEQKEYKLLIIVNKSSNQIKIDYVDKLNEGTDCLPINNTVMDLVK